ncbi:MAG: hypothetical protein Tsb0034_10970 [Ekhidna sp.]
MVRIIAAVFFSLLMGMAAWMSIPSPTATERINGASLVNPPRPVGNELLLDLKERVNANWVAVIPYAFSRPNEPRVSFDRDWQWWGEHSRGNTMLIRYAKQHNLKVMVKPHVWVRNDGWTGDFNLSTEEEWKVWEQDYSKYILNHAIIADSMQAEMLCIGTEYRIPAANRPGFWRGLISEVRKVYSGKLTYAANWDNYDNIEWWDKLDYIGIDAYFPLLESEHPSVLEIQKSWEPIRDRLRKFSGKWDKPILFTEYGFQSANGATGKHWEVETGSENANPALQANAYEATFRALEKDEWFAGGFFWKWHLDTQGDNWRGTEWTPQNKPAEKIISKWYKP